MIQHFILMYNSIKEWYKLFQVTRLGKNVLLIISLNAFDRKMTYVQRDKDPRTLRDDFKIDANIENNKRASNNLGRRDDQKLFNPRGNEKERNMPITTMKCKEEKMDQVVNLLNNLNPPMNHEDKTNSRLQNYPYIKQLKDCKPIHNHA